jgi:hypothetical protein
MRARQHIIVWLIAATVVAAVFGLQKYHERERENRDELRRARIASIKLEAGTPATEVLSRLGPPDDRDSLFARSSTCAGSQPHHSWTYLFAKGEGGFFFVVHFDSNDRVLCVTEGGWAV